MMLGARVKYDDVGIVGDGVRGEVGMLGKGRRGPWTCVSARMQGPNPVWRSSPTPRLSVAGASSSD